VIIAEIVTGERISGGHQRAQNHGEDEQENMDQRQKSTKTTMEKEKKVLQLTKRKHTRSGNTGRR
jgi:hypothetical protein